MNEYGVKVYLENCHLTEYLFFKTYEEAYVCHDNLDWYRIRGAEIFDLEDLLSDDDDFDSDPQEELEYFGSLWDEAGTADYKR